MQTCRPASAIICLCSFAFINEASRLRRIHSESDSRILVLSELEDTASKNAVHAPGLVTKKTEQSMLHSGVNLVIDRGLVTNKAERSMLRNEVNLVIDRGRENGDKILETLAYSACWCVACFFLHVGMYQHVASHPKSWLAETNKDQTIFEEEPVYRSIPFLIIGGVIQPLFCCLIIHRLTCDGDAFSCAVTHLSGGYGQSWQSYALGWQAAVIGYNAYDILVHMRTFLCSLDKSLMAHHLGIIISTLVCVLSHTWIFFLGCLVLTFELGSLALNVAGLGLLSAQAGAFAIMFTSAVPLACMAVMFYVSPVQPDGFMQLCLVSAVLFGFLRCQTIYQRVWIPSSEGDMKRAHV